MPHAVAAASDLHAALEKTFGFREFRPLQEDAIRTSLEGRDVLVVMPTGAGKSLCFQLPAILTDGLTLVISPLVALMRDQVEGLRARNGFRGLGAASLNSLQNSDEQREIMSGIENGNVRLLYVAPERFRQNGFLQMLQRRGVARFVVDEAHCISEWGHDFRPDYLQMRETIDALGRPPVIAVTATATLRVQESIKKNLGIEPEVFVGGFNRPNLHYAVHKCKNDTERQNLLARALPKLAASGSGLIYGSTRKQCEEVAAIASKALAPSGKKAAAYHAGLDASTRNALQSAWLSGEICLLAATNAFGMGIDKPDVRFVVHYAHPESLESYYQEAGRAGRDGKRSRCVILYHFADKRTREWFIDNDALEAADVQTAHAQIVLAAKKEDVVHIPRIWWKTALDWSEVKSRLALSELERCGALQRLAETADETILRIVERKMPAAAFARIAADLQRQRDERLRRLDEMVGYCKTDRCRRQMTLGYFGDWEKPRTRRDDGKLFCCDNCEKKEKAELSGEPQIDRTPMQKSERVSMPTRVEAEIHSLLQGMDALWPQVGRGRLNKILRGANSKEVERFRRESCPLLGALAGASESAVNTFLDKLLDEGLLHQGDEDEYFVVRVTRAGREAWQGKIELGVSVPNSARTRSDLEETDDEMFEALRDWRRTKAREENLPPYCVLGDKCLLEIARVKPQSEDELQSVSGIGPSKLEKYGAAILGITR
ncbi:MAG TPA: ATP-dependent DNA helicase RecQ [Abditibacteriaceae bacterium]|jgi:ATP-dependent DNA helicase RecQ